MKKAWLLMVGPFTDREAAEEVEAKLQGLFSPDRTIRATIAEIDGALEGVHQIGRGIVAGNENFPGPQDADLWSDDEVTPVGDYSLIGGGEDVDDTQSGEG